MLDFTALDFETANAYPNSACSLAAVTMHDAACVKEGYSLIRPPFMVFAPETVRIHGITPDMVAGKPKFNALWPAVFWQPITLPLICASCAVSCRGMIWSHRRPRISARSSFRAASGRNCPATGWTS